MKSTKSIVVLFFSLFVIATMGAFSSFAEVKTEVVIRKTSIVTAEDAGGLIKLLKDGEGASSSSLRFEIKDPYISIQCTETNKKECTIIAEKAGVGGENARALTKALGNKSYSSSDNNLVISCGVAEVLPVNQSTEPRRGAPFCNIIQK